MKLPTRETTKNTSSIATITTSATSSREVQQAPPDGSSSPVRQWRRYPRATPGSMRSWSYQDSDYKNIQEWPPANPPKTHSLGGPSASRSPRRCESLDSCVLPKSHSLMFHCLSRTCVGRKRWINYGGLALGCFVWIENKKGSVSLWSLLPLLYKFDDVGFRDVSCQEGFWRSKF